MYTLGMSLVHDTSACLVKDGVILGAIEEERLSKRKHTDEFPVKAIKTLLNEEGITFSEIDEVAINFNIPQFKENTYPFEHHTINHDDASSEGLRKIARYSNFIYEKIAIQIEENIPDNIKIHYVPHHLSHAAGTFFCSGYEEATVLVIDGRGENVATSVYHAKNNNFQIISEYDVSQSLGHIYTYITKICGLYSNIGQEGKTMGLAPLGKYNVDMAELFDKTITLNEESGTYNVSREHLRRFKKYQRNLGEVDTISQDLAYNLQKKYEEVVQFIARHAIKATGCKNLILSGGVALNCEGNRFLLGLPQVENLYIQPAANDGGSSLGAALYIHSRLNHIQKVTEDVYLGPSFSDE